MPLSGGCVCNQVRYEIESEPLFVHACHCLDCQRFSGSAFAVLMGVAKAEFKLDGKTTMVKNPTPSGAGYDANLCANCATVIWNKYHFVELPIIAVRGGTLDNPALAPPTYHIFTQSKQPWLQLPASARTFAGWLEPSEAWSEATLKKIDQMTSGD